MLFINFWCCIIVCLLILKTDASSALSDEDQNNCSFDMNKEMPLGGGRKINLNVHTNFKDEFSSLREMIKAEFAEQREEMQRQKEELTSMMKEELSAHKVSIEKFIKNELPALIEKVSQTVCSEKFDAKNLELVENLNKTISEQLKHQEKSFKTELKICKKWDDNFNCTENCGSFMDFPNSCEDAMNISSSQDGVYLLNIENSGLKPFYAYCQRIDNKVWTVIQRREDGSVDFYRNWQDYKHGFGNLYGEFWLGLERLNAFTWNHQHELHIWMEARNGTTAHAHYSQFSIGNETDKYRLSVNGYSGDAGDSLRYHNEVQFTTYDNDNDQAENTNIAEYFKGAWWFYEDYYYKSLLTGPYNPTNPTGVDWKSFSKKLKYTRMAIRKL